ncbi:MAG: hypothetical protein K0B37_05570 [Bacteroidales bacterium]|nr:hypothetical protein [Bacteroidales bacterium]
MEKSLRVIALFLLFFNGLGAIYGGSLLIYDPTGSVLQIPAGFPENSPFKSYLIPGIILFVANGLLSIFIAVVTVRKTKYYTELIILQGLILTGWLTIQIIMLRVFFPPMHVTCYIAGAGMIVTGFLLKNKVSAAKSPG